MPRVTESLRRQWTIQREDAIEGRTHDQSGRPRPPEAVAEQDFHVRLMDHMLSLPLGTKFDGQEEQRKLLGGSNG